MDLVLAHLNGILKSNIVNKCKKKKLGENIIEGQNKSKKYKGIRRPQAHRFNSYTLLSYLHNTRYTSIRYS